MIIAPPDGEMLLSPDDRGADDESRSSESSGDFGGVDAGVPQVCDLAREMTVQSTRLSLATLPV